MNPGASIGRIPAKVSLAARASVTAGLAKEVEAVEPVGACDVGPHGKRVRLQVLIVSSP